MLTLSFARSVLTSHSSWLGDRATGGVGLVGVHPDPERVVRRPDPELRINPPEVRALGAAMLGARQCGPFSEAGSPRLPRNTSLDVARTPRETPVGTTTVAPAATSTSSVPTTMTPSPSRKWNDAEGPG